MHRLLRSAAYRIALVYALGFTAATLVLGVIIVFVAHIALMRQLEGQILEDAGALNAEYRLEGHQGLNFAIREREAGRSDNELLYAVFAPDGRRIAGEMDAVRPVKGWSDLSFLDPREGADLARAWAFALNDGSLLVVAADKSVVERVDQTLIVIVLVATIVILILSLTGALILGAYLRRRLSGVSGAAGRIMAGDMTQRVPESGNGDEFDALARSLNQMLDRIAMLVENLRQVSGDVAHDLRTPLARLRTNLEESVTNSVGEQRERLESALVQADRLLALFASILRIAEIEDGQRKAKFQQVDLSTLVREIVESYVPAVEDGGRTLIECIMEGIEVSGDAGLLAQALINLLDNAQIHTPTNTHIHVMLEKARGCALLTICDNGPGVPPDVYEAIFRRFVRLDPGRGASGHGLGLNLVAAIVDAHDGSVEIGDNGPGLRIGFRLPLT